MDKIVSAGNVSFIIQWYFSRPDKPWRIDRSFYSDPEYRSFYSDPEYVTPNMDPEYESISVGRISPGASDKFVRDTLCIDHL